MSTMTVQELTSDERLALVSLLKLVVRADRQLSSPELNELREIARQVGRDLWHATIEQARSRFRSEQEVRTFAETITRPEAQKLIYKQLVRAARADGIVPQEASVLLWLARRWRVG